MRVLIATDDGQLARIERAIAEFEARPAAERMRKVFLLAALRRERAELQRCGAQLRQSLRAAGDHLAS